MFIPLYGLLAYAISMVTLAYTVGFVANVLVPKAIDGGQPGPWPRALAVDAALLLLFALQHSIMARPAFKRWWTRLVPPPAERSTYLLATCAALAMIFWRWQPIGGLAWQLAAPPARVAVYALCGLGVVLLAAAGFMIDHLELFGVRQAFSAGTGRPVPSPPLVTSGLYAWLRHPLMLGVLLIVWSAPTMSLGRLVFAIGVSAYILVGSWLEERDLGAHFGAAYRQYRQRTPMLIPRPPRRGAARRSSAAEGCDL